MCSVSGKMSMMPQFVGMTSPSFFWTCLVSLIKFSYWSKFHVNVVIGSEVITIYFYKVLTRNLEIGNTPVWVLSNIWRLGGHVRDTKFGTNVSKKKLLNAAKCQGCSFYRLWVIKVKPSLGLKTQITIHLDYNTQFFLELYFKNARKVFPKQSDRTLSKYLDTHMSNCISTLKRCS